MKSMKNLGFLAIVIGIVVLGQGSLLGFDPPPQFDNCSKECTCTVDPFYWNRVSAQCPDVAGVNECSYGYDACEDYCDSTLPDHYWDLYEVSIFCIVDYFGGEGCDPVGLEPPTNWVCDCLCFQD